MYIHIYLIYQALQGNLGSHQAIRHKDHLKSLNIKLGQPEEEKRSKGFQQKPQGRQYDGHRDNRTEEQRNLLHPPEGRRELTKEKQEKEKEKEKKKKQEKKKKKTLSVSSSATALLNEHPAASQVI